MRAAVTISLVPESRGGPFIFWDDLAASCQQASELGFEAVEVFAPGPEAAPQLSSLLRDYQLKLAAVGTGAGWLVHRLTLTSPEESIRRRALEFIQSLVDWAGRLGAPVIIGSMQGRSGEGVSPQQARDWLRWSLDELGETARHFQVPLLYEPLNRYETNLVNTQQQGVELLQSLQTDNVRLLADLFHMNIEEADVARGLQVAGRLLGHVHFVDSNRRPAGCGHLNFGPVITALRDIGYQGYLSAEALPWPDSAVAAAQTLRAFRYWTTTPCE